MKILFYGGTILTMSDPLYVDAALVENGKILALGAEEELRSAGPDYTEVNLNGATMMPGFIDGHSHLSELAEKLLRASLRDVTSVNDIKKRLAVFIEENHIQPGQWVIGRAYDHNFMPGYQNPTLEELDSITPENPLFIHHTNGHMALMNSLAMELMDIHPDTPAPAGGMIEVIDGKLTGYIEENAYFKYTAKLPAPTEEAYFQSFLKAQEMYLSSGITTAQDGIIWEKNLPVFEKIAKQGLLKLDLRMYFDPPAYEKALELFGGMSPNGHMRVSGIKMFLDGSPQGRTAWMLEPYADDPGYCGYPTLTDEAVEANFEKAAKMNCQILGHCNGDAAAQQYLDCLARVEAKYPQLSDVRPLVVHAQLMTKEQLERVPSLGALVTFFVAHTYYWGDVHLRNFGAQRGSHISATGSALNAGVSFTFHQDTPILDPNVIEMLWCATNRVTRGGVELAADERISVMDALRAVTVNGAYQYFEEEQKGTIAPGKRADFVVLSHNPLEISPLDLREIQVLHTYKDGKCVWSRA
jgi:predicted amidohydrolase YtcJ